MSIRDMRQNNIVLYGFEQYYYTDVEVILVIKTFANNRYDVSKRSNMTDNTLMSIITVDYILLHNYFISLIKIF